MSDFLRFAELYASRGWYVLPLTPNAKTPHHKLIPHGAKSASDNLETIRQWWKQCPSANVGIAAGLSRFHIVDIDVKNGDGIAELDALARQHGALPNTAVVVTPTGGLHMYFRTWAGAGLPNKKLSKNVDTRGINGYVVAPPSQIDGVAYRWEVKPKDSGVALLPAWVRDILSAEPVTATAEAVQGVRLNALPSHATSDKANAYALSAIQRVMDDIQGAAVGMRHDTFRDTAVRLVSLKMATWHTVDFSPEAVYWEAIAANPTVKDAVFMGEAERCIATAWAQATPAIAPQLKPHVRVGSEVTLRDGTRGKVGRFDATAERVRVGAGWFAYSEVVAW